MASLIRELFEIKKLGTSVALSEEMNVIQVADDRADGLHEFVKTQATQEIFTLQPPVNIVHARHNETLKLELMTALGNLYRAQFARPYINILEKVAVNGSKVGQIECTARHALFDGLVHQFPLMIVEQGRIANVQSVL